MREFFAEKWAEILVIASIGAAWLAFSAIAG
jgi:hypothetical protein